MQVPNLFWKIIRLISFFTKTEKIPITKIVKKNFLEIGLLIWYVKFFFFFFFHNDLVIHLTIISRWFLKTHIIYCSFCIKHFIFIDFFLFFIIVLTIIFIEKIRILFYLFNNISTHFFFFLKYWTLILWFIKKYIFLILFIVWRFIFLDLFAKRKDVFFIF